MVLENLKNLISVNSNKYPKEFQKILEAFNDEYIINEQDVNLLWSAYKFGDYAHRGQKENQENLILLIVLKFVSN